MTVASEACGPVDFSWTGAETSFSPGFSAGALDDVRVVYVAGSTRTILTRGTHYNASLSDGANLVTVVPLALPPAPATIIIDRETPATQTVDFDNLRKFDASVHGDLHDKAARRDAELRRDIGSIKDFADTVQEQLDAIDIDEQIAVANEAIAARDATQVLHDQVVAAVETITVAGQQPVYPTRAAIEGLTIAPALNAIQLLGYSVAGDGAGGTYKRTVTGPAGPTIIADHSGAFFKFVAGNSVFETRAALEASAVNPGIAAVFLLGELIAGDNKGGSFRRIATGAAGPLIIAAADASLWQKVERAGVFTPGKSVLAALPYSAKIAGVYRPMHQSTLETVTVNQTGHGNGIIEHYLQVQNNGAAPSAAISELNVLDLVVAADKVLHCKGMQNDSYVGSSYVYGAYPEVSERPAGSIGFSSPSPNQALRLYSHDGRPAAGDLPFFNLIDKDGTSGVIIAIGWTGQWEAVIQRVDAGLDVKIRQMNLNVQLLPLTTDAQDYIRSPTVLFFPWTDPLGWRGAAVQFRRYMMANVLPRTTPIFLLYDDIGVAENVSYANLRAASTNRAQLGFPFTHMWIEAGYQTIHGGSWFYSTGDEDHAIDPTRFPAGFSNAADTLQKLIWIEPERISPGTDTIAAFNTSFPAINPAGFSDWLIKTDRLQTDEPTIDPQKMYILKLSKIDVAAWLITHINAWITAHSPSIMRWDRNMDWFAEAWRRHEVIEKTTVSTRNRDNGSKEPLQRLGAIETKYVRLLYNVMDNVKAAHPTLEFDWSGGSAGSIDYELLKRGLSFQPSDRRMWDYEEAQTRHIGLSLWYPMHGIGLWGNLGAGNVWADIHLYQLRSMMGAINTIRVPLSLQPGYGNFYTGLNSFAAQVVDFSSYYVGDFYLLTYSGCETDPDWWVRKDIAIVDQYMHPTNGQSIVRAIRRPNCTATQIAVQFCGLNPTTTYTVKNYDNGVQITGSPATGASLMSAGATLPLGAVSTVALYKIAPV